ncbi:MAG: proline--tRNA ligase [bacterium]
MDTKKLTKLTPRTVDQAKWYQELVLKAELADYSPVSGCIIFRPYGYRIWELMQQEMDRLIKAAGIENAYFPLLIPYSFLEKEASHVEGFAPEVAIVTHAGGKELEEKLVIRPTSETIIYSMFAKWVHSYRDLPLRLNQWANVIRWEKRTLPFLRTSEFLWQEGHTIHATREDAEKEVTRALEMYKYFMNKYLNLFVVCGRKTETEKFAGAVYTTTLEAMMKDGKALQCGTSHLLNQSFAKSFNISFVDQNNQKQLPWMTSWGSSTRMIGAIILAHGDDQGLMLPPKVAPYQGVIVPIYKTNDEKTAVKSYVEKVQKLLTSYRITVDWSDNSPGWKFAEWEMKGVPVRIEIGKNEVKNNLATLVMRVNRFKKQIKVTDLKVEFTKTISEIEELMFNNHQNFTMAHTFPITNLEDFKSQLAKQKGFIKTYFSGDSKQEKEIKNLTKATTRCRPFDDENDLGKCFYSGKEQSEVTLFARAY